MGVINQLIARGPHLVWNITILNGKTHSQWPFSIAMWQSLPEGRSHWGIYDHQGALKFRWIDSSEPSFVSQDISEFSATCIKVRIFIWFHLRQYIRWISLDLRDKPMETGFRVIFTIEFRVVGASFTMSGQTLILLVFCIYIYISHV